MHWANFEDVDLSTSCEVDEALVAFKNCSETPVSKSHFACLVSAVELVVPSTKRALPWSHAVLAGCTTVQPVKHHVPMSKAAA